MQNAPIGAVGLRIDTSLANQFEHSSVLLGNTDSKSIPDSKNADTKSAFFFERDYPDQESKYAC